MPIDTLQLGATCYAGHFISSAASGAQLVGRRHGHVLYATRRYYDIQASAGH